MSLRLSNLLPIWVMGLAACSTLPPISQAVGPAETIMNVEDQRLDEISGMASSNLMPGVIWMHNDSGDDPRLFAVDAKGKTIGILQITNARARDWEDMTRFEIGGVSWLLIADVGDNNAVRDDTTIYLLPEPDPRAFAQQPIMRVTATSVMRYRYENGPRDCEGVAVDVPNQRILLISKRTEPPVLYTLPLELGRADDDAPLIAQKSIPLTGITPPTAAERTIPGRLGRHRSWVTAFDISADNHTAAVLTYGDVLIYNREEGQDWTEVLGGTPERVPFEGLRQAESLSFDEGGATLLVSTEDDRPPVRRYRLR